MEKVKIFISYSNKDTDLFRTFKDGITNQSKNSKEIEWNLWSDLEIPTGSKWHEIIQNSVQESNAVILLVSDKFLSSDYIINEEFAKFIERQEQKNITLFPVLLSDCIINQWIELSTRHFFKPLGQDYCVEKFKNKIVPYDYIEKENLRNSYHRACVEAFEKTIIANLSKNTKVFEDNTNQNSNTKVLFVDKNELTCEVPLEVENVSQKNTKIPMEEAFIKAKELANEIKNFKPTLIFGIGRGGAIFGSLISYNLSDISIEVIDRYYNWNTRKREDNVLHPFKIPTDLTERVLLVAGEAHTGGTLEAFDDYLKQIEADEIKTCVFYKQTCCTYDIDFVGIEGENIPLMPWQEETYIRDSLSKKDSKRKADEQKEIYSGKKITAYIVRHAETIENADGDRFIGSFNAQLSDKGTKQAIALGNFFANKNIDVIYTSPLKRCFDTAFYIQQKINGASIIQSQSLKEMDYGEWENIKRNDVEILYPESYEKYKQNPYENYPSKAENPKDVVKRIKQFWKDTIPTLKENANIVIVTHKTIGRLMICDLNRKEYSKFREEKLANASITKVKIDGENKEIEYNNKELEF